MTYTITNEESGRSYSYASEESYLSAERWYNASSKSEIYSWCESHGLSLLDPSDSTGETLLPDWHDAAMALYAQQTI